jgi:heptosyltransferase-1
VIGLKNQLKKEKPAFLLVKLSSLGDVLHNIPIVWDIRERYPDSRIDWVVEEAYVDLLRPLQTSVFFRGIDRIIPFALRRWRRNIFKPNYWQELFSTVQVLKEQRYDWVIDSQGLIKSAIVASLAGRSKNTKITGLANATEHSSYEPLARFFYTESVRVPKYCHAIDRSRYLLSSALNIPLMNRTLSVKFYPNFFVDHIANASNFAPEFKKPYVLCFHATAREAKKWSIDDWVLVGRHLLEKGLIPIYPWGNQAEKKTSDAIVHQLDGGLVPKAYSIHDYFQIISQASLSIGVDTGLTHLSAVLNKPTIEIYCDSPVWKTEGYWSEKIINLGDLEKPPSVQMVISAIDQLI